MQDDVRTGPGAARPAITDLLGRWKDGDDRVVDALGASVYPAMRAAAQAQARRCGQGLSLSPTELLHEGFMRLQAQRSVDWQGTDHFLAIAGTMIRRAAIDHMRGRARAKRGGDVRLVSWDALTQGAPADDEGVDWDALGVALDELSSSHPDVLKVVELRVFAGLTKEQVAERLGISRATVGRYWRFARAWLAERLDLPHRS